MIAVQGEVQQVDLLRSEGPVPDIDLFDSASERVEEDENRGQGRPGTVDDDRSRDGHVNPVEGFRLPEEVGSDAVTEDAIRGQSAWIFHLRGRAVHPHRHLQCHSPLPLARCSGREYDGECKRRAGLGRPL